MIPVLPQEDPIELDGRINQWLATSTRETTPNATWSPEPRISPGSWSARRCETARLTHRVRKAQLKAKARRIKEVGELGRRLLYNAGARILPTSGPPWEDNPAAFLAGSKKRRGVPLAARHWVGLRVLLDRDSEWTYGDMFRLVRLLGKYPVEAVNDPALNAIFLAWDTVVPGWGERFWKECKRCKPLHDPGFSDFGKWREIVDRPADAGKRFRTSTRSSMSKWRGWKSFGRARGDCRRRGRRAGGPGVV